MGAAKRQIRSESNGTIKRIKRTASSIHLQAKTSWGYNNSLALMANTNGSALIQYLNKQDKLTLSNVSKEIFRSLSAHIERTYYFHLYPEQTSTIASYNPRKLHIYTPYTSWGSFQSITHLKFANFFNSPVDNLPKSITHLSFGEKFDQPVENLPPKLTHLTFRHDFDQPVENLPPTITHLIFGYSFNQRVDTLPGKLKSLSFGFMFDQPLSPPPTLTHLIFGHNNIFSSKIRFLPPTLAHFSITSMTFVRKLPPFPPSLTTLLLHDWFNSPVDDLPPSLSSLQFGFNFDKPVDKLPQNLKKLQFGFEFNQPVDQLPASLQQLSLGYKFNHPVNNLPPKLTHLTFVPAALFNQPLLQLPQTLLVLGLGANFSQFVPFLPKLQKFHLEPSYFLQLSSLPPTLKSLEASGLILENLKSIPSSLSNIKVWQTYNGPDLSSPVEIEVLDFSYSPENLPNRLVTRLQVINFRESQLCLQNFTSLNFLSVCDSFNLPLDKLPNSLSRLLIGESFNLPLDHLPSSLQKLRFKHHSRFNHPVKHLPPSLKSLKFGKSFNQNVDYLPRSLETLWLGVNFDHSIDLLPPGLRKLIINNENYRHSLDRLPMSLTVIQISCA